MNIRLVFVCAFVSKIVYFCLCFNIQPATIFFCYNKMSFWQNMNDQV